MAISKDIIVKELQRISSDLGYLPGKRLFERLSTVKESDWAGKHWSKWNDLVSAAGLEANERTQRIETPYILEKMVSLIRHYGRMPTSNDIRLYALGHKGIPTDKTLGKHLGPKENWPSILLNLMKDIGQYSDVVSILQSNGAASEADTINIEESENYVYLLEFGEYYKIGSSINVERRFNEIKTIMPEKGKIVHSIKTGDPAGIEAYWHKYFADQRVRGEWFKLSDSDVRYFKRRKLEVIS
jgi:hypothetical protein